MAPKKRKFKAARVEVYSHETGQFEQQQPAQQRQRRTASQPAAQAGCQSSVQHAHQHVAADQAQPDAACPSTLQPCAAAAEDGEVPLASSRSSIPAAFPWDFACASKFPLLWVDSHGDAAAEAVYLIPYKPEGARKWRFGFLGLRYVRFSDGDRLVGWCKNCPCGQECCLDRQLEQQDRPHVSQAWLGEAPHMCELGEALVRCFGGPTQLRAQLQQVSAGQHGAGKLIVSLPRLFHGKVACTAVRAGDSFRDWGCIDNSDHRCASCQSRQRSCAHIGCLPAADREAAAAAAVQPMMSPEAYEEHLMGVFDLEQGCRKRKCLSSLPLPAKLEEPRDEAERPLCAELLKMYNDRCSGETKVPSSCPPTAETLRTQPCPSCSHINWAPQADAAAKPCRVFLPAAERWTTFPAHSCRTPGCAGTLVADGREYFLLRYSEHLVFGLELLYQFSRKLDDTASPFSTHWQDSIASTLTLSHELQHTLGERHRMHFEYACLDFWQLQRLDYMAAFSCPHGLEDLTGDGIALGNHSAKGCIMQPWAAADAAPLQYGSSFADRTFVPDRRARNLLRRFSSTTCSDSGLTADELASLRELLAPPSQPAHSLLPFLSAGSASQRMLAARGHRQLLQCLATTAPAAALLPSAAHEAAAQLVATRQLSLHSQQRLDHITPVLFGFLRPHLPQQHCDASVCDLVAQLLKVAKACHLPSRPPQPAAAAVGSAAVGSAAGSSAALGGGPPTAALPSASADAAATDRAAPSNWTSREEAFMRTAVWSGFGPREWQPSPLGGNHVYRRVGRYAQDVSSGRGGGISTADKCTKHQRPTGKLVPGLILFWCMKCRKCVLFSLMPEAESPRTVADLLQTHMPAAPQRFQMDNACNLHAFVLNREPEYYANTQFLIDDCHWRGHVNCSAAYYTGNYPSIINTPLAEQRNSVLRKVESMCAYMHQTTLLWFLRRLIYAMNKQVERTA